MGKILVVTEKPSVAQSIAAVLGAKNRGDGYLEGGGWLISWCFGHLVELAPADAYGDQYKRWSYLSCDSARQPVRVDEKHIEAVVSRILHDWWKSGAGILPASVPAGQSDVPSLIRTPADEIIYDDALEKLGEDGYNTIAGALDTFRNK